MNENTIHGGVKWQSPSNIAIVKYWGKRPGMTQIPQNPSVSFTLSKCCTETSIFYEESDRFGLHFRFDGKENPEFQTKIAEFLKRHIIAFPFLEEMDLPFKLMRKVISECIYVYNNLRPHLSCGYNTPEWMHSQRDVAIKTYKRIPPQENPVAVK